MLELAKHTNYWKVVIERFFWLWHHLNRKLKPNQVLMHKLSKRITVYCSCLLSLELGLVRHFLHPFHLFFWLISGIKFSTRQPNLILFFSTFSFYPLILPINKFFHKSMVIKCFSFKKKSLIFFVCFGWDLFVAVKYWH